MSTGFLDNQTIMIKDLKVELKAFTTERDLHAVDEITEINQRPTAIVRLQGGKKNAPELPKHHCRGSSHPVLFSATHKSQMHDIHSHIIILKKNLTEFDKFDF